MHLPLVLAATLLVFSSQAEANYGCEYINFELRGEWCYLYQWNLQDFDGARDYCSRVYGAELISIHSAEENDYASSFTSKLLLGLYYKGNNQFEWTDESAVDYLNLADNFEVNRSDYKCVKTTYGKWKNYNCDAETHSFICKKKAEVYPDAPSNACPDQNKIYTDAGDLYSPGFPENYNGTGGLNCQYHLQAPEGDKIVFELNYGDLSYDKCGTMEIYEGWVASPDKLLLSFTTWYSLPVETKSSNQMLIVFKACGSGYWRVSWYSDKDKPDTPTGPTLSPGTTTVHHNSDVCPRENNITSAMRVQSPGFPFTYDTDIECDFNAYVPPPELTLTNKTYVYSFELTFEELIIGTDDWIDLLDARTGVAFESTRDKVREGDIVAVDFNFVIRFHSGSTAALFDRWAISISQRGAVQNP